MWADVNFSLNKQSEVVIIVNICYISDVQIFLLSGSRNSAMLHVHLCVCFMCGRACFPERAALVVDSSEGRVKRSSNLLTDVQTVN